MRCFSSTGAWSGEGRSEKFLRPRKIVDMQSSHLTKEQKQRKKQEEQTVVVGNEDLEKPPT